MTRRNRGFTLFELLLAVTIVGAMAALALPQIRKTLTKESVRSARRSVTTHLARARATASSRGCRAILHVTAGGSSRLWVTACDPTGSGIDTVGSIERLSDRFGVTVAATADSIQFAPNGLALAAGWTRFEFTKAGNADTLEVSPLGKAFW